MRCGDKEEPAFGCARGSAMVSRHIEQAECMRRQGKRHLMDVKRSGTSSGRAVRCRSGNAGWGAGVFAQAKRAAKKE